MKAGALALFVDDAHIASGHFGGMFMFPGVTTSAGGLWIGCHEGLPIVDNYSFPNDFTGHIQTGQITGYWNILRQPWGRVHLAGEHVATCTGYMEGAVESGRDVADRIVRAS